MNDFNTLYQDLRIEWSLLRRNWAAASEQWQDQIRAEFERQHWVTWEEQVEATLRALEELRDLGENSGEV